MSKFSIFTIFLSVTVTVIVAELLVNQYIRFPASQKQLSTNVLAAEDQHKAADSKMNDTAGEPDSQKNVNQSLSAGDSGQISQAEFDQNDSPAKDGPKITFAVMQNAGFTNLVLQRVPFNGILFNTIDLRNFKSVEVIQNNLIEDNTNRNQTASFFEFDAGSRMLATEIYSLIKQKTQSLSGVKMNETNQFGNNSFYINFDDNAQNVFLVVRMESNVYALTYRKDYHPFIKQLLTLLSK